MPSTRRIPLLIALIGVLALSLWQLRADERGIVRESLHVGETPVTVYRGGLDEPAPVILVAHGFAGSRRLMEPFALALAGSGYVVVTYDFLGHGRHPLPMRGDLGEQDGTSALLIEQTAEVAEMALSLPGVEGGLALVGHSMATNILVRYAQEDPRVRATVGVSLFAPTIDASTPRNLLVIVGALEGRLEAEGRRVVAMRTGGDSESVASFTTYGDLSDGSARRLVVSPRVEHVGVLYSATTLDETRLWLDGVFEWEGVDPIANRAHGRGLWIALLMVCVFLLARPLATLLPRVAPTPGGADATWKRLLLVAGLPALVTPFLLRPLPTGFLPVVVGDYLGVHFLAMGLFTAALLWWTGGRPRMGRVLELAGVRGPGAFRLALGAGGMVAFFLVLMAWPLDRFFTSFFPVAERIPLMVAVLVGVLPYFLADEWLTRGTDPRRGAYAFTKVLFLLSLALAVALDFQALFFLIIIFPVVLIFFVVHGLFSRWAFRSTGSPLVAGLGNSMAFAWAIAVTFPMYAGG
ncbi:MAG: alpha/beta fold hydrolase [Gemmatimonadales bacterium]|nr:MAG: alpha/beta fold hydrolase [Gemmatimonadales bacterium]